MWIFKIHYFRFIERTPIIEYNFREDTADNIRNMNLRIGNMPPPTQGTSGDTRQDYINMADLRFNLYLFRISESNTLCGQFTGPAENRQKISFYCNTNGKRQLFQTLIYV